MWRMSGVMVDKCATGAVAHPHALLLPPTTSPTPILIMSQHSLPELPYAYDGLEPYISRQIMELHHKKHHQTYVNALNAAEASYAKAGSPKERIALQQAIKFNGGGHINHSLFWKNMAPPAAESKGSGGQLKGACRIRAEIALI
jgi:superoxide dismutase